MGLYFWEFLPQDMARRKERREFSGWMVFCSRYVFLFGLKLFDGKSPLCVLLYRCTR
jgi:hypothetical protein